MAVIGYPQTLIRHDLDGYEVWVEAADGYG